MNNPFDYIPSEACDKAFRRLLARLEALRGSQLQSDACFIDEISKGKMLGVMIAKDKSGIENILYAFSGQIGENGFHFPGFVGPVLDYLQLDGYFKTHEAKITLQNIRIAQFEESELKELCARYDAKWRLLVEDIDQYKEQIGRSKEERRLRRRGGNSDDRELAAMIRQSQFEKAELKRKKQAAALAILPLERDLKEARALHKEMKDRRRRDSEALQEWLFDNTMLLNARGESRSLAEIFADTAFKIPPSGAGECCAPKLLQEAYLRGWTPLSIAEYWYGAPKEGEVRRHGEHYPACRGKCLPVLTWMLQGLEVEPPLESERNTDVAFSPDVIFQNRLFCVIAKPSGMLSVAGKGSGVSAEEWLQLKYGAEKKVKMVHRLDQDTSGLLIAAFGEESYRAMQSLFASRGVKKRYEAILEGDFNAMGIPQKGSIELPLSPDWLDRPRQRVDVKNGKWSLTEYEFQGVEDGRSRVSFYPMTGRTHQLRVHSASEQGLGMPIVGDRLYGIERGCGAGRLMLHAQKIEFTHPIDEHHYSFEIPVPF